MIMKLIIRIAAALMIAAAALMTAGCTGPAPGADGNGVSQTELTRSGSDIEEPPEGACSGSDTGREEPQTAQEENGIMTYMIKRVSGDIDWGSVPALSLDNILWEPDCGICAGAQLCHDGERLYVHLRAVEKDIRAEYTAPLSPTYEDSCLEFFFMPESEDRYFNFEINPNGCLYIGFGHDRYDSTALYREDMREYFDIRSARTDDGWEVYFSIPLEFLNVFYNGYSYSGTLMANVYKCGDKTEHRHYLSWNPVRSEKPDFHRPQDFGRMVFE